MKSLRFFITMAAAVSLIALVVGITQAANNAAQKSGKTDGKTVRVDARGERPGTVDYQGGPDGFGYRYVDNQSGDTATYSWIELRGDPGATWLDFLQNPDDATAAVHLNFMFPLYGGPYDSVVISTNGTLQFQSSASEYSSDCLPTENTYGPTIAVLWEDLHCDNGGYNPGGAVTIGYRQFADYIVVEWDSVGLQGAEDASLKFQAILWADGRMKLQYNRLVMGTAEPAPVIGIQADSDGPALGYVCSASGHPPVNGLAIWIVPGDIGSITGSVRDSEGNPLFQARIRIRELGVSTVADNSGDFAFPAVAPGIYSMTAYYPGYMDNQATGVVVTMGQETVVQFALRWAGSYTYPSMDVPVAIEDETTVTSALTITDDWAINDLNVYVNITHTYASDLVISLSAPGGQTAVLSNACGGSGENFDNTMFDDEAFVPISMGTAPFVGSYIPDEALSVFDGLTTPGTWTLSIEDQAGGDTGELLGWGIVVTPALAAEDPELPAMAQSFALLGNYPNPFNSRTTIRYNVPQTMPISLRLYNVLGQEVLTLVQGRAEAGLHSVAWDGRDARGVDAASGLYLIRLEGASQSATGKLFLLR
ncbi:MAG: carboxypeptidase regulatory-like domain-containing protein [bacterium]|nr:carboxypeptidase regulatory-like domain-containing protein [bacterium]